MLTILTIFSIVIAGVSFVVGQKYSIEENSRRLTLVEDICLNLDYRYMPRGELQAQLDRIEQKIDLLTDKKIC